MKTKLFTLIAALFCAYQSGAQCLANFTYTVGANGQVTFSSTSLPQGSSTGYYWSFGNGGTYTTIGSPTATTTYSANGSYPVTLFFLTPFTCSNTITYTVQVNTAAQTTCAANFNYTILANGVVNFTNTSASSASNPTYNWSFGNNTNSTSGTTATTTYTNNGNYFVMLFMNSSGCTDSAVAVITITNSPCNITAGFNYSQSSSTTVNFTNQSSGNTSSASYFWDFGDMNTSTQTSPTHSYANPGTYLVTLTAATSSACVSTYTTFVHVASPCFLNASYSYTVGSNGQVNFASTSTGTTGNTTHLWIFGDNTTGSGPTTTHAYGFSGTYYASLIIFNPTLTTCNDSVMQQIVVTSGTCNLQSSFTYSAGSGGEIFFSNTSTGTTSGTTYLWNFADGFTSTLANPTHTYISGGSYNVTLTAVNNSVSGCSSATVIQVNVTGAPCVANANFTLVPSNTPGYWFAIPSFPYNWSGSQWSWGDSHTDTAMYASHQYTAAGTYTICLTVTASCGATATACTSQYLSKTSGPQIIIYVNVMPAPPVDETHVGIEERRVIAAGIYPNPASDLINIDAANLPGGNVRLSIVNLVGETVIDKVTGSQNGLMHEEISTERIPAGIYFVQIIAGSNKTVQKIIIEK